MKQIIILLSVITLLTSCAKDTQVNSLHKDTRKGELILIGIDQSISFQPKLIKSEKIEDLVKTLELRESNFDLCIYFVRNPNEEKVLNYRHYVPKLQKGNDLESRRNNANALRRFESLKESRLNKFLEEYKVLNKLPRSQYTDIESLSNFLITKVSEPRYRNGKVKLFTYTDGKHSIPNKKISKIKPIDFPNNRIQAYTCGLPKGQKLFESKEIRLTSFSSFIDNLNF